MAEKQPEAHSDRATQGTPGHVARIVHVVDDDASMREGVARSLSARQFEARCHASGHAFLAARAERQAPAILLLDMCMPDMTGVELQRRLRERGDPLPIVFVSGESTVSQAVAAVQEGAVDFLVKPFGSDALLQAVEKAFAAEASTRKQQARQESLHAAISRLTPREAEVFGLLCRGYRNAELVAALGISLHTAKQYKTQVMQKLGVATLSELLSLAAPWGNSSTTVEPTGNQPSGDAGTA